MNGIVAMSLNRVIGKDGKIPWKLSEDLKFFKEKTYGYPLVMGRKTFDSIGLLKGRHIYIITHNKKLWGKTLYDKEKAASAEYLSSQEFVLKRNLVRKVNTWVCGGAEIYKLFLPWIEIFYVTVIDGIYEGDTFMPVFENLYYKCEIDRIGFGFKVLKYTR